MAFTSYLQDKLLKHVFKVSTYTPASQLKLALGTSAPGPTDITSWSGEVSGGSYARQNVSFSPALGRDRELAVIRNSARIDFPQATASWGTVTYAAIFNDDTIPSMLGWFVLCGGGISVGNGDQVPFLEGVLAFALAESHYPLSMQRALLNHTFAGETYTPPSNIYLGLFTNDYHAGMEAADLEEPSGGNYSRLQHNSWSVASQAASNSGTATFATASANWPDPIKGGALFDQSTGGTALAVFPFGSNLNVSNGDAVQYNSGTIIARVEAQEIEGPPEG